MNFLKNILAPLLFILSTAHASDISDHQYKNSTRTKPCFHTYCLFLRLKNSMDVLHKIPEKIVRNIPFDQLLTTDNTAIKVCISRITQEKNLNALFYLWHRIIACRILCNKCFFKEYSSFICKVLYFIKTATIKPLHKNPSTLDTLIVISQKIDRLPIIELLNTIDMLTQELPAFLEKYEFNSGISWKEWLKKYWWLPPIITIWFGLKILVKFQHRPGYLTLGYYQPQPLQPPILTNDPALLEIMKDKQQSVS